MSEKKSLVKNIMSLGIVQIANMILPLISIPIIARIIGPDKYGVVNYAASFITYFTLFIAYGFDLTSTRKVAQNPNDIEYRNKVFSETFWAKNLLFIISVFIFIVCVCFVTPLNKELWVSIFTFLLCISTVFTSNWIFQAMQDLTKVALFNFFTKLLFTILVLIVVRKKEDYLWMPLLTSVVAILISLISFLWAIKKFELKISPISIKRIFSILNKEKTIYFSNLAINLYSILNVIILGIMKNETEVGYYTSSERVVIITFSIINTPIAMAIFPFIGAQFSKDKSIAIEKIKKIFPLIFIFTFLAGISLFIFSPLIIKILYGNQYIPSINTLKILSFVPLFIALSNFMGVQIMLNLRWDRSYFYITFLGVILSIIFNVIFINRWGYLGSATAWCLVEFSVVTCFFIFLKHKKINVVDVKEFNPKKIFYFLMSLNDEIFHKKNKVE